MIIRLKLEAPPRRKPQFVPSLFEARLGAWLKKQNVKRPDLRMGAFLCSAGEAALTMDKGGRC